MGWDNEGAVAGLPFTSVIFTGGWDGREGEVFGTMSEPKSSGKRSLSVPRTDEGGKMVGNGRMRKERRKKEKRELNVTRSTFHAFSP